MISSSGDPACLAFLAYRLWGWWKNSISFIKNSWLQRSVSANHHGSKSHAGLKNQYWRINWTIVVCLSGYLKIDEQKNAKHTKQPREVYRHYSKAEKLQGNSPSRNSLAQHWNQRSGSFPCLWKSSQTHHLCLPKHQRIVPNSLSCLYALTKAH